MTEGTQRFGCDVVRARRQRGELVAGAMWIGESPPGRSGRARMVSVAAPPVGREGCELVLYRAAMRLTWV